MKRWSIGVLLAVVCFAPLQAAEEEVVVPGVETHLPGVALAEGITEITGVAISPLLGVSSVGAWHYFKTPESLRNDLPWYCQPWAWGTGFTVLSLIFLKDSLGAAAPGILKKPFDMAELFENKASALVASAAFVPLVAREMARGMEQVEVPAGWLGVGMVGAIDPSWLMVPLSLVAFAAVWVCSHAINVLIILSPFSLVDTMLKLARMAMLLMIGLFYWIAPWLGAAICLLIILVAAWLAPSALRLMIFGTRFAGDVLLPWRADKTATPERPHVFTLGSTAGLPARTGGRLASSEDGGLEFRYRRFCLMPETRIELADGERDVVKGLLSPAVFVGNEKQLVFLPRYRGREEDLVGRLRLKGVREHSLTRGWAAAKAWLQSLLGKQRAIGG
jgi:hypothetical protein